MRIGKFALVGLTGLLISEAVLFFFTEIMGFFYIVSGIIAVEVSVVGNFLMHERWTFSDRERKDSYLRRLGKYNLISIAGMFLNVLFLYILTEFFGIYYLISNILAAFIVFNWNYFVNLKKTWKYDKPTTKLEKVPADPLVSIVIPTYNEKENIEKLVPAVFGVLEENKIRGEIVVVDDNSPDRTWKSVKDLEKNFDVKLVRRKEKSGLSTAVLEGIKKSSGDVIGVMDADFSHPPETIPEMVKPITGGEADMTVGDRYMEGGGIKGWPVKRRIISWFAGLLARPLTSVKDTTTGFFFFNKNVIRGKELNPSGYKIGLEIFVKGDFSRIKPVPFTFVDRKIGESKLGVKQDMEYLYHLIKLYWYKMNK